MHPSDENKGDVQRRRGPPEPAIDVRIETEIGALEAIVGFQREVWNIPDVDVLPLHFLRAVGERGGFVLGAWAGDALVGFLLTEPALDAERRFYLYLHMIGVRSDLRDMGIGHAIWSRCAAICRERGITRAVGLYDPLEGRNANLYIHGLGGIGREYRDDYYGRMTGANSGLPSDRLLFTWEPTSPRALRALVREIAGTWPEMPPTIIMRDGTLAVELHRNPVVRVEIPADIQRLKMQDAARALRWRLATREALSTYLGWGYEIRDFVTRGDGESRESFYVLLDPSR